MATSEIRDNRAKDWFYLDNELLEVFGGKGKEDQGIGIHAMGVYMVLAKHANNDTQQCKPSYQTIATLLGVSRNTVITAIKTLDKAGLISVEQRTINDNKKLHTTNIYTLRNIKAPKPIPTGEPARPSPAPPSARDALPLVQEVVYPSAPEVPELHYSNKTNLNKTNSSSVVVTSPPPEKKDYVTTTTARPGSVKSEAVLIEEYFLLATTGTTGFMSAKQREVCKDLEKQGMTVERAKPGIDQTIAEMNAKGLSVSSIQLCVAAIYQLDSARAKPTPIASYQKPAERKPFEQPKKPWDAEAYKAEMMLTPAQEANRARKRAENEYFERMEKLAWEQEAAAKQQQLARLQA